MKDRLPIALSSAALIVALFGVTPIGSAAGDALSSGTKLLSATAKPKPKVLRGPRGFRGARGPAGPAGSAGPQGAQGPAGAPNPNAVNAQNADNLDNLDSLDFIRSNAVFGGDLSGPFSDLQIGADTIGTAEVATNSLTGGDIASGTLGGFHVADSSLDGSDIATQSVPGTDLSPNSVTGTQIAESTLGQVPSAANADNVDGQSAVTFNYNVPGPSGNRLMFTFGGLTLRARCDGISPGSDELNFYASTDANDSYIRTSIGGVTSDTSWDIAEGNPGGGAEWFDSQSDNAGVMVYRRGPTGDSSAQVTTVTFGWNTISTGCMLSGTVLGH